MTSKEKINQLAAKIKESIIPLIDNDYVLYGLPYYSNIGDTLIWEGELDLLKEIPYKCVGTCAWDEYPNKPLPKDTVVLITGGGYFGDTWREAWKSVLNGIKGLEKNKIIFLPNSIYYSSSAILEKDSEYLSKFNNLIICARDQFSYDYAKKNFQNKVLLIPDMAFCISPNKIRNEKHNSKGNLYLRRNDKELNFQLNNLDLAEDLEISDWPTMGKPKKKQKIFHKMLCILLGLHARGLIQDNATHFLKASIFKLLHRPMMTKEGVNFISKYENIYTTRLHAMILGIFLDKKIYFLDNSYGKLRNYYETWLKDCDNVKELHG